MGEPEEEPSQELQPTVIMEPEEEPSQELQSTWSENLSKFRRSTCDNVPKSSRAVTMELEVEPSQELRSTDPTQKCAKSPTEPQCEPTLIYYKGRIHVCTQASTLASGVPPTQWPTQKAAGPVGIPYHTRFSVTSDAPPTQKCAEALPQSLDEPPTMKPAKPP